MEEDNDLASLAELDESILLERLHQRYRNEKIYTYVGDILLAVNPFKKLGIYEDDTRKRYSNVRQRSSLPPHIFAVADHAFRSLRSSGADQVCVISGESGAGKTETSKLLICQVLHVSRSAHSDLQSQILEVNPVLEALGNARTVMNHNSSRFGKFFKLLFDVDGAVVGASLEHYLLEKSRVVSHSEGESNFHVFYLMFAGLSDKEREKFFLGRPEDHRYLSEHGQQCVISTQEMPRLRNFFQEMVTALNTIGFDELDYTQIFSCLSAVLHCGDIEFASNEQDIAVVSSQATLQLVGQLLGVDPGALAKALTVQVSVTRGETINRCNTVAQSGEFRDSLSKIVYGRLFASIICNLNLMLAPESSITAERGKGADLCILDIFGFENFKTNSFEQFCINVANEQLQYYFNQHIFRWEQEEYVREGIHAADSIKFTDNRPIIELFFAKPTGMFHLLDDESKFHRATPQTLIQKFNEHSAKNRHYVKSKQLSPPVFSVNHYAGCVTYNTMAFLEKNRDALSSGLSECLQSSKHELIKTLFTNDSELKDKMVNMNVLLTCEVPKKQTYPRMTVRQTRQKSFRKTVRHGMLKKTNNVLTDAYAVDRAKTNASSRAIQRRQTKRASIRSAVRANRPVNKKAAPTVGSYFRSSLAELMVKMLSSTPHFVRCIKPNAQLLPDFFDREMVARQLKYTGVLETTRIRQMGYPTRLAFDMFLCRYSSLADTKRAENSKECCELVLEQCGVKGYAIGHSKVLLRYNHTEILLNHLEAQCKKVILVQKMIRGFLARREVAALLEEYKVEQMCLEIEDQASALFIRLEVLCAADKARMEQEKLRQEKEQREKEERVHREKEEREREQKERFARKQALTQREKDERDHREREQKEKQVRMRKKMNEREEEKRKSLEKVEFIKRLQREHIEREQRMNCERAAREQLEAKRLHEEQDPTRQRMIALMLQQLEAAKAEAERVKLETEKFRMEAAKLRKEVQTMKKEAEEMRRLAEKEMSVVRPGNSPPASCPTSSNSQAVRNNSPWCIVSAMEKHTLNSQYSILQSSFFVDGSDILSNERLGLNALPVKDSDPSVAKIRPFIGKGVCFTQDSHGCIWATRHSKNHVFVKGWRSDFPLAIPPQLAEAHGKLEMGIKTKIFDIDTFRHNLRKEVSHPTLRTVPLFAMCRIGVSFVKDSSDPSHTPCWVILDLVPRHADVTMMLQQCQVKTPLSATPWLDAVDPDLDGFRQAKETRLDSPVKLAAVTASSANGLSSRGAAPQPRAQSNSAAPANGSSSRSPDAVNKNEHGPVQKSGFVQQFVNQAEMRACPVRQANSSDDCRTFPGKRGARRWAKK